MAHNCGLTTGYDLEMEHSQCSAGRSQASSLMCITEITTLCHLTYETFVIPVTVRSRVCNHTVGAKINFPFPFLTDQDKGSRTDRAVGIPCLLYAFRIFSNHIFGIKTT